jgi:mgtE-like transporter
MSLENEAGDPTPADGADASPREGFTLRRRLDRWPARPSRQSKPRRRFAPLEAGRSVRRHWQAERRTIRVGAVAHGISALTGLGAGVMLAAMASTLEELPGLLILVPASIGLRGNIFGAFGSRLGTSLALGTFELRLRRGAVLRDELVAVAVLTLATSAVLAVLARLFAAIYGGPTISVWAFAVMSVLGAVVSSLVVAAVTITVAWAASRFDWDLDAIAAPLVTLAGDLVGIPALALVSPLALRGATTRWLGVVLLAGAAGVSIWGLARLRGRPRRILVESLPVLSVVSLASLASGTVLQGNAETLLAFGVFLIVLPSFLEACGGFGGMFASRLSSRIHLGAVNPRLLPEPAVFVDSTLVYLFAAFIFPAMAAGAGGLAALTSQSSPGLPTVFMVVIAAGAMATTLTLAVAYYAALSTVRFGLDPDNHAVPLVTSSMDLIGTLSLAGALIVLVR